MQKKIVWEWEKLDEFTRRAKVIGGWIVHSHKNGITTKGKESHLLCSESAIFVPDRDHEWTIVSPIVEVIPKKSVAEGF